MHTLTRSNAHLDELIETCIYMICETCRYRGTQHNTIEIYRRRQFDNNLVKAFDRGMDSCTCPTLGYACRRIMYIPDVCAHAVA